MTGPNEFPLREFSEENFQSFLMAVERSLLLQEFIGSDPEHGGLALRLPEGTVTLHPGRPNQITTAAQLLGAAFRDSEGGWTWHWGWENPYGLDESVLSFAREVFELGSHQEGGLQRLFCERASALGAGPQPAVWNGYFASGLLARHNLAPLFFDEGEQYLVLAVQLWEPSPPATARLIAQTLRAAQEVPDLPWQSALASYAAQRGLRLEVREESDAPDDPSHITMRCSLSGAEGGPVHAVLDAAGRLIAIESAEGHAVFEYDGASPDPVALVGPAQPVREDSWSAVFDQALLAGVEQRLALGEFVVGFRYFLSEGHVLLNPDSDSPVNAPAQLLGVAALEENGDWVWRWGWENPFGFPDQALTISRQLRSIAERKGIEPLLEPSVLLPNGPGAAEGYGMIAAHLMPGLSPLFIEQDGQVAVAMMHFEVRAKTTARRIARAVAAAAQSAEPADWPRALRGYAERRGLELSVRPEGFVFQGADGGPVTVVLDQRARIIAVDSEEGRIELRDEHDPAPSARAGVGEPPPAYPLSQELFADVALWSWDQQLRLEDVVGGDSPYNGPFYPDVQAGSITFNHGREPSFTAKAHVLGTASPRQGSWLWGWANPNGLPSQVVAASASVRDSLLSRGHEMLAEPELPLRGEAREVARRIGAVASHVTGLPCFTFEAGGGLIVALLVEHPMLALREPTTFRIDQVLVRAVSAGVVADWPRALAAYAEKRGLGLERDETGYALLLPSGGAVSVELDDHGRVGLISSRLDRDSLSRVAPRRDR